MQVKQNSFFWVCILALSGFYLTPGLLGWPGLHIDAFYYSTPVISAGRGEGWLFGGFAHMLELYPDRVYRGHGFIHIIFFGEALRCGTWKQFMIWCGVVNAASCMLWGFACRKQLRTRSPLLLDLASIATANLAGLSGVTLQGRPEHLVVLATAILLLVVQAAKKTLIADTAVAFTTACVFCMSPALGILMACAVACYCAVFRQNEHGLISLARFMAIGIGAIFVSFILIKSAGFSLLEWCRDTFLGFQSYYAGYFLYRWFDIWSGFSTHLLPLWNFLFCLSSLRLIGEVIIRHCWWALLWLGVSTAVFVPSLHDYTYVGFLPGMFVLLLYYVRLPFFRETGVVFGVGASIASVAVIHVLAAFRMSLLMWIYLTSGVSIEEAQMQVALLRQELVANKEMMAFHFRRNACAIILDDPGPFFLQVVPSREPGKGFMNEVQRIEAATSSVIRIFIYPQTYRGVPPDRVYLGAIPFVLREHNWVSHRTTIAGVPIGGPYPGYQFAVYDRLGQ